MVRNCNKSNQYVAILQKVVLPIRFLSVAFVLLLEFTSYGAKSVRNDPPLVRAVKAGDVSKVAKLLAAHADPNIKDKTGRPAILCIADAPVTSSMSGDGESGGSTTIQHKNHRPIVELLVKNGANVNVRTKTGWTPLLQAQAAGELDLMAFLRKAGEKH